MPRPLAPLVPPATRRLSHPRQLAGVLVALLATTLPAAVAQEDAMPIPELPAPTLDTGPASPPAKPSPPPGGPGGRAVSRPTGAAGSTTGSAPAAADMVPRLEFPNTDVRDVLNFYGRLTGKKLVYDNTVQGPVNIVITTPVAKEEAIRIIETNLLLNGFSLVPGDGDIVKVTGLAKNPRTVGIPIVSDLGELPETDKVVTYLFKLQFADPVELQQTLAQYIAPSLYTSIIALPKAGALLVTESTPVLRTLVRVIKEIDVPPASVISEFIKLERADVEDVIEKLEKIFETQPTPGRPAGTAAPRPPRIPGQPPTPDGGAAAPPPVPSIEIDGGNILSEDSIIVGKIRLTADIRTNRIHVVTRPINLPFVRTLIKEFDSDVKFGDPATRTLKFVAAGDILDPIVQAISEKGEKAEGATGAAARGQGGGGNQQQPSSFSLRGGSSLSSSTSGMGAGGSFDVSEGLATEPRETTPLAVVVGTTKIIADRRTNSIIVLGNDEMRHKIFRLIDQLDVRAPQVVITTVIGAYNRSNDVEVGFNYFLGNSKIDGGVVPGEGGGADGNTTDNTQASLSRGGVGISNSGLPFLDFARILSSSELATMAPFFVGGASGLNAYLRNEDALGALVTALEQTGRLRITNRPVVVTSNNKKAIIASGEEIAVPTQTLANVTDGAVVNNQAAISSNVQFKQVGLQLEVVPLINSDREVALDILQKLDNRTGETTEIGGNQIPTFGTRYIRTSVSVPNGVTVILGGLITEEESKSAAGIPFISRIPYLGALFRNTHKTRVRKELVIMMRPEVVTSGREFVDATISETDRLDIDPNVEQSLDAHADKRAIKAKVTPTPFPTPALRVPR